MKTTLPCIRPRQKSSSGTKKNATKRHRWKKGICIHCGIRKSESLVRACDCGCKRPIGTDTLTTTYGNLIFIFSHETLNLFEDVKIFPSKVIRPGNKCKKKSKKVSKKEKYALVISH